MEAYSTWTSTFITLKIILQENLILTTNMLSDTVQIYNLVFLFIFSRSVISAVELSVFLHHIHICDVQITLLYYKQGWTCSRPSHTFENICTHGSYVPFIWKFGNICTVIYQIKKSLTLCFLLVDQSISITVYRHSIWQNCQHYHKDGQNRICFSCYVVSIPVGKENA